MGKNNLVVEREKLQFTMSRELNAPIEKVWKAYTDPEAVSKWWGQRSSETIVEEMDVRVGGKWRYIQREKDGTEYAFRGEYTEVEVPTKLTSTFEFEPMPGHISTDHAVFEALPDGRTKMTVISTFANVEDLDGMIASGMEGGAEESWDQLEEYLTQA